MSLSVSPAQVSERLAGEEVPLWVHPEWEERFPWLVQGTTGRGGGDEAFDLGLSGAQPVGVVLERWRRLLERAGRPSAVHARQVHGADLWVHGAAGTPGLLVMAGVDGHVAAPGGPLLTVSVADCVPVSLVDPARRVVALLHAGWRGVAGGILERALDLLQRRFGVATSELWMHCGPAICEACYPVGPEVHAAVEPDRPPPPGGGPLDVRAALARRGAAAGLEQERCSVSAHCTRCGRGGAPGGRPFFSHRAGDAGRQMAVLGFRE